MRDNWLDWAACRNHPVLDPEAWFAVEGGFPRDEGAQALLVCRSACPVRAVCREKFEGVEVIAGGGWWDARGIFRNVHPELFDVYLAAAYIGVHPDWVRRRIGQGRGFTVIERSHGRVWFSSANVKYMARVYGPKCGTPEALRLHQVRGDGPCRVCNDVGQLALTA